MTARQKHLVNQARRARARAYVPFSQFPVGAALETARGKVYTGANIENASYGLTLCAERVAIFKAVSEGERSFKRLAVVAAGKRLTPPCGACRQIIWEFCGNIEIILADPRGRGVVRRMRKLLPEPFDASVL